MKTFRTSSVCLLAATVFAAANARADKPAAAAETDKGKEYAAGEYPASVLKRFDKNKNGALEPEELAKWEAEKAERRDKYAAERAAMLEKFDTNKDGKLSEEERATAKIEMNKERSDRETEKMRERAAKEAERIEQEKAKEQAATKAAPIKKDAAAIEAGGSMMGMQGEEKAESGEMMMK